MATNKQIIQGAYQAFAEGDVPKVPASMDDEIEWTEAEGFLLHGTYIGPQAVVDGVFMRLGEIGDEFTVTPTRFVVRRQRPERIDWSLSPSEPGRFLAPSRF
jgi:ketosteroid isomerase-like protein